MPVTALVDHWTSSQEARSCKPDPDIFAYALAKAELGPTEALYVGDSLPHDVAGAHAAGLGTVHLADTDQPTPLADGLDRTILPDHTVGSLAGVLAMVDGLLAP